MSFPAFSRKPNEEWDITSVADWKEECDLSSVAGWKEKRDLVLSSWLSETCRGRIERWRGIWKRQEWEMVQMEENWPSRWTELNLFYFIIVILFSCYVYINEIYFPFLNFFYSFQQQSLTSLSERVIQIHLVWTWKKNKKTKRNFDVYSKLDITISIFLRFFLTKLLEIAIDNFVYANKKMY